MSLKNYANSQNKILLIVALMALISCKKVKTEQNDVQFNTVENEMVVDLNNLTYTIANQHDQFYSFIGVRALAMVHLGMHDIFNAVQPTYKQYHFKETVNNVNPIAASIASTRVILSQAYPKRVDTITKVCNHWLDKIKDNKEKKESIVFGEEVALSLIAVRKNDGHEKRGGYTPMTKPGNYQYTPGYDWVLKPDFSVARPFTLDSLTQFRSPIPPSLDSKEYELSYKKVKDFGSKNSKVRTIDQTNFAHWWAEFGEHSWNRIGRLTAKEKKLSIIETNRMFALINMNLYDLYLVSLESKYFYDTWRPYTAIREGKDDTNLNTKGDVNWEPEMVTPPWPEYPSAHAATGAAGAEILSRVFGTPNISFTMKSVTALPSAKIRSYTNLNEAANDCADSRIMNGYHFRFATEEGKKQGRAIAKHTLENFLLPIN